MNNQQVLDYLHKHGAVATDDGSVEMVVALTEAQLSASHTQALLTRYALLEVTGEDAAAFLQGQFSSDVAALGNGGVQWSSYSNAKGRMQASFLLWRRGDAFYLLVRADIAEAFRRRLSMFVMRSKVKIALVDGVVFGEHLPEAQANMPSFEPLLLVADDTKSVLSIGGHIRVTCFYSSDLSGLPQLGGQLVSGEQFDLYFINAGVSWVSLATFEAFVPQMANLDLIGGIGFRKGCYPGQEVVARTQYLGKVKRRGFVVDVFATECQEGSDIKVEATGDQAIGKVVLSVPIESGKYRAFIVMQISAWDGVPYLSSEPSSRLILREAPYLIPELQSA